MTVFITLPVVSTYRSDYFIKCTRQHSKGCLDRFERYLSNYVDAFIVGNDFINAVYLFVGKLYYMYNCCCTICKKNVSRNRYLKPWIRDSHVKCINTKYRLFPWTVFI